MNDTFKRGDTVWIKIKDNFVEGEITKKVMPHHGVSFDKDATKWYVFRSGSDFRIPYYESDLISWIREKKINDITL
jgi:hypothetical protein